MATKTMPTAAAYLASLAPERRAALAKVRQVIRKHLPPGYRETMNWGMISYEVPLARYPDSYNGQPLCYAALAAHKNHLAIYLTAVSQDPALRTKLEAGFKAAGKTLDMGKSCIRFRKLEDIPLDVIGKIIAATPVRRFIAQVEATHRR